MGSSWNPEIHGLGAGPTPSMTSKAGAREASPRVAPTGAVPAEPREQVEIRADLGAGTPVPEKQAEGVPDASLSSLLEEAVSPPRPVVTADVVPEAVRARLEQAVQGASPSLVALDDWAMSSEASPAVGPGASGATSGVGKPLPATSHLVATRSGSIRELDSPSMGPTSTGWNEDAIRSFTSRGIPIRDLRARTERPEWQVDTKALRVFLEADAARSTIPSRDLSIDYRGDGVPQADCVLSGPGPGGGYAARLTLSDGRTLQILSDGPLERKHITNVARTVGESNPRMFRSRYPGQGDTTVLVADHLGQFTSRGRITDVGGLGGNGPTITLDRLMLDSEHIGSLTHEWMHSFDHAASVVSRQARASDGKALFGPEGSARSSDFVTSYARTNPLEDFAESGEWVNDVLVQAHGAGTDLVRAGGEAFRRYLVDHWTDVRPDRSEAPAPRLLEKASFIYKTLDLAPDTPVRFTLAEGALPVDADRTSEVRRDVQILAANNPSVRSAEVEIGGDPRTYRLVMAEPGGGTTTATLRIPHNAQTDLATTAPLLSFGDVSVLAPEGVYVPTIDLTPREGSGLRAGHATTVLGPDLYMEGEGAPAARLERVLQYGVDHGKARDLVLHVGADDLAEVVLPLRQLLASGFPELQRVTLVDCQGGIRVLEAADGAGHHLPVPREVDSRGFGELPPQVRAELAAREAAAAARQEAMAPRHASPAQVEAVSTKVAALAERVGRLGSSPEVTETSEMLGMLGEMLAAPSLSEEELESIVTELMQVASRVEGGKASQA